MRPILLKVSGFGPYANEVSINLSKLGQSGVYLITGDTGAGKTTIFDAITYVLYGEASGKNRQTSSFRSKYANPDTETFVEMKFLHNGEEYFVKRNPEYQRPKKRGEGTTKQDAQAVLIYPDGRQVVGVKDVSIAVAELLCLNQEQFKQIIMLPQNDFTKMLLSNTKDRIDIFRDIFNTDICNKLQSTLTEKNRELEVKNKELMLSIVQYIRDIKNIECIEDNGINLQLEEIKENIVPENIEKVIDITNKIELQADNYLQTLKKQLEEYKTNIDNKKITLDKVEKNIKLQKELEILKVNLIEKQKEFEVNKKEFDLIAEYETKLDEINKQLILNQKAMSKFNDLDLHIEQKIKIEKEIKELIVKKEVSKNNLNNKNLEFENINNNIQEYTSLEEKQFELSKQIEEFNNNVKKYKEIVNKYKEYLTYETKLEQEQQEYLKIKEEYEKINCLYLENEKLFFDSQAGIFAENIKEGDMCPVCGSIHHPNKAKKIDKAPTQQQLEIEKTKVERLNQKLNQKSTSCCLCQNNLKNKENELSSDIGKLFNQTEFSKEILQDNLTNYKQYIKSKSDELKYKQEKLNNEKQIKQNLEQQKETLEKEIPILDKQTQKFEKELAINETNLTNKKEVIENLQKELNVNDKNELLLKINEGQIKSKNINDKIKNIRDNYNQSEKNVETLKARIEEISKQIEKIENINVDDLIEIIKDEENKINQLSEKISNINFDIKNNTEKLEKIKSINNDIEKIQEKYKIINPLYKTATGTIVGKNKINFETYVQMKYFDKILEKANIRFSKMTNNQYILKRREEDMSLKDGGLELNVLDNYNNAQRDSKTLSGGELFKASLSLALGLSDEIQESCGGVKIETMFIDEGFGSLDEESLRQAIDTLDKLSGQNRLIGIISHVAELKQRIDKKIIVTKNRNNGSNIKIET